MSITPNPNKLANYYLINIVYYISDADTFMKLIKVSKRMINIIKTFKINTIMLYKIPKSYYPLFENIETLRYSCHDLIVNSEGDMQDIKHFKKYFKYIIINNHEKHYQAFNRRDSDNFRDLLKCNCFIHIFSNFTKCKKDNFIDKYNIEKYRDKVVFHDCLLPPEYSKNSRPFKWCVYNYVPEYFNFEMSKDFDLSELSEYSSLQLRFDNNFALDFSKLNLINLIIKCSRNVREVCKIIIPSTLKTLIIKRKYYETIKIGGNNKLHTFFCNCHYKFDEETKTIKNFCADIKYLDCDTFPKLQIDYTDEKEDSKKEESENDEENDDGNEDI